MEVFQMRRSPLVFQEASLESPRASPRYWTRSGVGPLRRENHP